MTPPLPLLWPLVEEVMWLGRMVVLAGVAWAWRHLGAWLLWLLRFVDELSDVSTKILTFPPGHLPCSRSTDLYNGARE